MNLVKKLSEAVKFGGPSAANVSPELLTVDRAWADMQMQKVKQQTDLLEGELKNYKRNSIKESIRVCICLNIYIFFYDWKPVDEVFLTLRDFLQY